MADKEDAAAVTPTIAVVGCTKTYPGVQALNGVSLEVAAGEIRGLVGQNGAGKSTLVKIMAGAIRPDAGTVSVSGRPLKPDIVAHRRAGISVIYQDPQVVPSLSACENVFLGGQIRHQAGFVDRPAMRREFLALCAQLNVEISPARMTNTMSLGDRQLIEIMRAVRTANKVLILDEPTSRRRQRRGRSTRQHQGERRHDRGLRVLRPVGGRNLVSFVNREPRR